MSRARWLPLAGFSALLLLLAAGVWLSRDPGRDTLPSALLDRPAPAFALPLLHEPEKMLSGTDLHGAPYLLNVWGSWCPECREEHAVLTAVADSGRIRVIGYNWRDERDDALRWLQQFGDPYALVVADVEGTDAIDWGISGAPETFLVDAAGVIRWKHVGALTDEVVRDALLPRLDALEAAR